MVSRDLVPMRERIAGPRGTGKPLQIAVDGVPGTTEATETIRPTPVSGATVGGDNEFPIENLVLLHPPGG